MTSPIRAEVLPAQPTGDTIDALAMHAAAYLRGAAAPRVLCLGADAADTAAALTTALAARGMDAVAETHDPDAIDVSAGPHAADRASIAESLAGREYDLIHVAGTDDFAANAACCIAALLLVGDRGIVCGDRYDTPAMRTAVLETFGSVGLRVPPDTWVVYMPPSSRAGQSPTGRPCALDRMLAKELVAA